MTDQSDALRFVALVDRLYDAQVAILATGTPLDQVFGEEMLAGGYRKKYLRAVSRLIALTNPTPSEPAVSACVRFSVTWTRSFGSSTTAAW